MTDKIPSTDRLATQVVQKFLHTATAGQRNWYLAQGNPEVAHVNVMKDGDFTIAMFPSLRGIIMGKACATEEEAYAQATAAKEVLLAKSEEFEPFDEIEAEIDNEAADLQNLFSEASLRLEAIAHIATMQDGSPAEPLENILDNMDADYPCAALADLPFLANLLIEGDLDGRELAEEFVSLAHDYGMHGFLIEASVPEIRPMSENSFSVHYSTRRLEVFYGATFAAACRKALAWAEEEVERMRTGTRKKHVSLRAKNASEDTPAVEQNAEADDGQGSLL